MRATDYVKTFAEIGMQDVRTVGGKNASLGEMFRELAPLGVRVPDGFAVTADAYRVFLAAAGLDRRLPEILNGLDVGDVQNLRARGRQAREAILGAPLPADVEAAILAGYADLVARSGGADDVAVRSSATAEDLPTASFAGQQETYLNVHGPRLLLDACKRCIASLFTDRAIAYRVHQGFDHFQVALSVGVQRMVRSDLSTAGVMFSLDTESGFRDVVLINAAYGLGENIVQGAVNPDEYCVFKPTLLTGHRPIIRKRLGTKEFRMIYDQGGSRLTKNVPVAIAERKRFALSDDEVLQLAEWACAIEKH